MALQAAAPTTVTVADLTSRTMCVNAWDVWLENGNHPCVQYGNHVTADGTSDYKDVSATSFKTDYFTQAEFQNVEFELSDNGNKLTMPYTWMPSQWKGNPQMSMFTTNVSLNFTIDENFYNSPDYDPDYGLNYKDGVVNKNDYLVYAAARKSGVHKKVGSNYYEVKDTMCRVAYGEDITFHRIYPDDPFLPEDGIYYESDANRYLSIKETSPLRLRLAFLPVMTAGDQAFDYKGLLLSDDPEDTKYLRVHHNSGINTQYRDDPEGERGYNLVVYNAFNRGITPTDDGQYRGWRGNVSWDDMTLDMEPLMFYDNVEFRMRGSYTQTGYNANGLETTTILHRGSSFLMYERNRYVVAPAPEGEDVNTIRRVVQAGSLDNMRTSITPTGTLHNALLRAEPWTELPNHCTVDAFKADFPRAICYLQGSYKESKNARSGYDNPYLTQFDHKISFPVERDYTHHIGKREYNDFLYWHDNGLVVVGSLVPNECSQYVTGYDLMLIDNVKDLEHQKLSTTTGIEGAKDVTHLGQDVDDRRFGLPCGYNDQGQLVINHWNDKLWFFKRFTADELHSLFPTYNYTTTEAPKLSFFVRAHYQPETGLAPTYHSLLPMYTVTTERPEIMPDHTEAFTVTATPGHIAVSGMAQGTEVRVFDMSGRQTGHFTADGTAPYTSGIYMATDGYHTTKVVVR